MSNQSQTNDSPKKPAPRFKRLNFSKLALLVFIVGFGAVGTYLLVQSFAKPPAPTIYLNPEAQTLPGNTSFSVQVRVDSGTTAVNAVQANFSYPAALVDFVSINTTGTAFPVEAQNTGGSGQITIARGITGSVTGDQLVATVNFRTKTTGGTASMAFTSGSALVSASGNQNLISSLSATGGGSYIIDVTLPTVSISTPAQGASLAMGATHNITTAAADANGISKVEVFVDGALKATLTASPYTYAWNTTGVAAGNHTIYAKAYDSRGNTATSTTVTVTLADKTAPSAPGSFRATASTLNSISLAWNASTDNIGVTSYRISRGATVIATVPAPSLSYSDTGLAAGTSYNYTIVALDAAGNVSTAAALSTSTQSYKPGDINQSGAVDITDLSILLTNWSTTDPASDINDDGIVNVQDLSILLTNYGT